MKYILSILFFIPLWLSAQNVQTIEVCSNDQSYLQEYWVDGGPNIYTWVVEGGTIESGQGTSQITVNWLNVPYDMYQISVSVISNEGCVGDTVLLTVDVDECSFDGIYVPNTFTPNGDGINDIFGPIGQNIIELELFIYNRWGGEIYQSYHGEAWDGTYKDKLCQQDVYVWLIYYRFEGENFMHDAIGHVVLLK